MVNPFDETQQAGQLRGPAAGIASLPGKFQHDPNQEYRSFQVRANEPDARALERYVFDVNREYGQHPMNIDIGLHSNWEERQGSSLSSTVHPFHPLNVSNKRKIDPVTNTDAMGDYTDYLYNRLYQNAINKEKQKNTIQAGITNQNLDGYKVWNAGGPMDLWNYLKRFTPWYDPEQDYRRHEQYQEQNPDLQLEQDKLEADERYRINELQQTHGKHYYGGPGEYYPDKILRDAFPQSYPYLGGLSMTTDSPLNEDEIEQEKIDKWIEDYNIGPEDLGVEPQLEANLSQTWQTIVDKTGNEELANQWLESQQANRGGIIGLL